MVGMLATADIVLSVSRKNVAMKIRKIAGRSPIRNHSMAKGIHASGDINRKNWSSGTRARRAEAFCQSHKPAGMPSPAEITKPTQTRHNEAIMSLIKVPAKISRRPLSEEPGEGSAYSGKNRKRQTMYHKSNTQRIITRGKMKLRGLFFFIGMICTEESFVLRILEFRTWLLLLDW